MRRHSFNRRPLAARLLLVAMALTICLIHPGQSHALVEGRACGSEPTDESIQYGDLIWCEINPLGDSDLFGFQGVAGQTVVIDTARTAGGVDPCIHLYDPDGVLERNACGFAAASNSITTTLLKTGTYTIMVFDGGSDETGTYDLILERVSPVSPSAVPIDWGSTVPGDISALADLRLFVVGGRQGSTGTISTARTGGGVDPCINLYDPDGVLERNACGFASVSNSMTLTFAKTGNYTVMVFDGGSDETGTFSLSVQCISGPCPSPDVVVITS